MCDQAAAFENTCRQRQGRMGAVGTVSRSTDLQAGDFGDCATLYGKVAGMCRSTEAAAARPVSTARAVPPPPAAAPASPPPAKPADGTTKSAPPPTPQAVRQASAMAALSPQCQAQLNQMLEGADTGDKAKAGSAYGLLRGAECDAQMREIANAAHVGLPERRLSTRARGAMDRAMAGDASSTANAIGERPMESGGSGSGGSGFDAGEVLEFASAILGIVGAFSGQSFGGVAFGAGTNYGSLGRRASSTYGQGSPGAGGGYRPPPVAAACPGRYVCSAR